MELFLFCARIISIDARPLILKGYGQLTPPQMEEAIFIEPDTLVIDLRERKKFKLFQTWEPYGYMADGKAKGFEIETFEAVADLMGYQVEFSHQPWKRCLHSVENGLADVVISALKVKERTAFLNYPDEPISISRTAFFTKKESTVSFNGSFEDIKKYTIGMTSGFSYGELFDSADYLNKDPSTETEAVLMKVLLGRNELGVGNIPVIKTIAQKKNSLDKIKFLTPLLHSQKLYVGFSKTGHFGHLAQSFSSALSDFKKTERYKIILQTYNME